MQTMKSPAFQFYPTDYLGSQRVQLLTLEEEGAYVRLLCSCWQHGSIPADPDQAARLIGKGASTTVARVVLAMFQPSGESGRLIHDRLEAEREKQAVWREKSSAGGRKSAEMRKGGSRVVEPPHQPNGNTPSPSPSPSPISDLQNNTSPAGAGVQGGTASPPPAGSDESGKPPKKRRAPKPTDGEWLAGLKSDPAFTGIDIDREHAKATRWCAEHGKTLSRQRLTNWLNRCEVPMSGMGAMKSAYADAF